MGMAKESGSMAVQRVWGKANLLDLLHRENRKDFPSPLGMLLAVYSGLVCTRWRGAGNIWAKMELVRNREDLKPEYIWSCIYRELGNQAEFSP